MSETRATEWYWLDGCTLFVEFRNVLQEYVYVWSC